MLSLDDPNDKGALLPMQFIRSLPWALIIIACLTLGLAPFKPLPHVAEKTIMLLNNELNKGIDIFDFFFHLSPFLLAVIKFADMQFNKK